MLVYKATFPNGKIYIGCTVQTLERRKQSHKCSALKKNSSLYFHRAISKYGFENITWDILFQTDDHKKLLDAEIKFIDLYKSNIIGYNLTKGGQGTLGSKHNLGKKRTLEQKNNNKKPGKIVFLINCKNKTCIKYVSIAEAARKNNIPYSQAKTAFKRKQPYFEYKFSSEYSEDFYLPEIYNSIPLKITNGNQILEFKSLSSAVQSGLFTERQIRKLFHKNKEINGWRKCV